MTKRWSALGLSVLLLALIGGASPADAAVPVTSVGWWTRSPSPPTVPDGGLSVGEAPDGNLSVAAIMIDAGGGASAPKLSLAETDGQAQQAASLQVCTTTDQWSAVSGGPIEVAPRPTCPSEPVLLTRADDGTWSADLTELLGGQTGDVSLMVVPAPAPAGVPGVAEAGAFQVGFKPPTVDGTVAPESSDSSSSSFGGSDSSSGSSSFPASTPFTAPPPSSVASSPAFAPVSNTPSAVLPTAQADSTLSSQDAGGGQVSFPVAPVGAAGKKTSKAVVVGIVALSILIGAVAAGLRSANERGVFSRLIPSGGGSTLKLPN